MREKKLGRGLDSLLSGQEQPEPKPIPKKEEAKKVSVKPVAKVRAKVPANIGELVWLNPAEITPNRFQPRQDFDPEGLKELTESIKSAGVIQPLIVRRVDKGYELVAGERRWRACRELTLPRIPVLIKEADDRTVMEWAIIENTQRRDLNPIERARAYQQLAKLFNLTQDDVAERVGLDRSTVANFIRLLELPREIQSEVSRGTISMGHARTLLALGNNDDQIKLVRRIKREGMSVRRLEYIIRYLKRKPARVKEPPADQLYLKELEERMRRRFGTKVSIKSYKSKGYINIEFYSNDDFLRILETLGT